MAKALDLDQKGLPAALRLGTSSFSCADWCGGFYPEGLPPGDFLEHYARVFRTVEIDATWYAIPSRATVAGWARKTPDDFVFSLKVPRSITHEASLEACDQEWARFLKALEPLRGKRGPLLLQFPYFAKGRGAREYETGDAFRRRLAAFLRLLPEEGRYVVEVRNGKWIAPPLLDLLRERGVALALVAYYTLPGPEALLRGPDPVTADFGYVRLIGDHKRMDALVAKAREEGGRASDWGELLVDRARETAAWVAAMREILERPAVELFAYVNNHFAGFAPGSLELLVKEWRASRATTRY